jgi:uroporphyrinogen decarboxylase
MTPRERVLRAMRRDGPDKVPRELPWGSFTPELMEVFKEKTGADDPAEYFDYEVRQISFINPKSTGDFLKYFDKLPPNTRIDDWGTARLRGSEHHFEKYIFPMAKFTSPYEVEEYPFPDYMHPDCHRHFESTVKKFHERGLAVSGELTCTIFEISWYIRGMENLLMDFTLNPELAAAILDKVLNIRIEQITKYVQAGVDIIWLGDDVGQQVGLIMSPETWRKWLKPRLSKVIGTTKSINPKVLIFYHSDGDVKQLIPELIEIGIDILNPIQPECMDPAEIKRTYGDRLSFWGTIGTQTTMPFGTPKEVKKVIKERIETVGEGGGLLLAPTHILEPEVPWENVLAFFEAIEEYGYYK